MKEVAAGFAGAAFCCGLVALWLLVVWDDDTYRVDVLMLATGVLGLIGSVLAHWLPGAIIAAAVAALALLFMRNTRKRRKAPKAWGAKSRARIESMTRKMRERAQPQPDRAAPEPIKTGT